VHTDHYSLKYLLDQRLSTIPQHHLVSKLLGFDFTVEYWPISTNTVADALSQRDTENSSELRAISTPSFRLFDDLRAEHMEDTALWSAMQAGDRGTAWRIIDGIIMVRGRSFVMATSPLLQAILVHAHSTEHEGMEKTPSSPRRLPHFERARLGA
jgi:hypothetical protein